MDVLRGVHVAAAVAKSHGYTVVFFSSFFGTNRVKGDHIRPVLVDVCTVGKVDHIRCESAGRTQVYLQGDHTALFAKIVVIPGQAEKLKMNKTAFDAECRYTPAACFAQVIFYLFFNIEDSAPLCIYGIHDRFHGVISGFQERVPFAVDDGIVGIDISGDKLFHNVLDAPVSRFMKTLQIIFVAELKSIDSSDTFVRFYYYRIAYLLNEGQALRKICHQVKTSTGNLCLCIVFFHAGFALDDGEVFRPHTRDIEILPQSRVLLQPVLIVALESVDFSVFETEEGDRAVHLIIVFHRVDPIILCQGSLKCIVEGIIGGIPDSQHVDPVRVQLNTEISVVYRKMR